MKSYINKFLMGLAVVSMVGLTGCVNDLDQTPTDPNTVAPDEFKNNPKEYMAQVMAKCYSSLAVSGQSGPDGGSDISGLDGGTSNWTRVIFMLNEFTTDEVNWIWPDVGVGHRQLVRRIRTSVHPHRCVQRLPAPAERRPVPAS